MNKKNLLFLAIGICSSIVAFGQKTTMPAKPAEKPAFAYLLATTDLDVKVTVLNTQKSYTVRTSDELVKIGLDAGDNIIKVTPLDGGNDGYTVTKTADKPGNIALSIGLKQKRDLLSAARQKEKDEWMRVFERERLGEFKYSWDNVEKRVYWGNNSSSPIKYALLPKGAAEKKINLLIEVGIGDELNLLNQKRTVQVLAQMLNDCLENNIKGIHIGEFTSYVSSGLGANKNALTVIVRTDRQNIDKVIPVLVKTLKKPEFRQESLDAILKEVVSIYEIKPAFDLCSVAYDKLDEYENYAPNHPYSKMPNDEAQETLKKMTLDDIIQFNKQYIGANNMRLSMVGDFDLEPIQNLIQSSFKDWKSEKPYSPISQSKCRPIYSDRHLNLNSTKKGVSVLVYYPLDIYRGSKDLIYLEFIADIFQQRIFQRLYRDGLKSDKMDEARYYNTIINCGFLSEIICKNCDKEDAAIFDKVIEATKSELFNLIYNPISYDEIERNKTKWSTIRRGIENVDDDYFFFYLDRSILNGYSFEEDKNKDEAMANFSPKSVNDMVKKYFTSSNAITMKVMGNQ